MKKYIKISTILLSLLIWCIPTLSFSAELYFETKTQKFSLGDEFLVSVFLNTEGKLINATEGEVTYSSSLLEIKEIRYGNSVVNFWIERPEIKDSSKVVFSGIIPGGYQNASGFLFSIVFQAKASGVGVIDIKNARVLQNDSTGTPVKVSTTPLKFDISENGSADSSVIPLQLDTIPPEGFKPEISRDNELFDGRWFIVFATQDKGSGIDHYEICEGSSLCTVASSPHPLNNQKLDQRILVKAVDKKGNTKEQVFYPANWKPWYRDGKILGIIILIVILSVAIKRHYGKLL